LTSRGFIWPCITNSSDSPREKKVLKENGQWFIPEKWCSQLSGIYTGSI
jgi:hypothetical protein